MDKKEYLNHSSDTIWFPNEDIDDALNHTGVKNMRWHHRRYQNYDGSLTPLGRSHYGVGPERKKSGIVELAKNHRQKAAAKKKKKQQVKNLEKAREAKKKAAEERAKEEALMKDKERIITSGTPEEISKLKGKMTNQEFNTALTRLNYEEQLDKKVKDRRQKTGSEKFVEASKKVGDLATASTNFINLYNNGARVYNAFYGKKKNRTLPTI